MSMGEIIPIWNNEILSNIPIWNKVISEFILTENIPKAYVEAGVVVDGLFLIFLFLYRRPLKTKPPTQSQLRALGAYLVFMSFFVLLFTRAFTNYPSYLAWGEGVALCAFMFLTGFSLISRG
ncbi:hypothetical protein SMF1_0005 [Sulfolobales Mexican fusellovirus 1]|uniref:hypothetical protein n=1 Tax=Sulfolobales Mexican fusellovirus 1 TaxID=1298531 RepID=UPI0002C109A9|nr:hypothetical protein SMF1_0005 [Sulfolobales Mexican fusellovirus 1]AGG36552.1 hypothetical protein SMF1_0005 [Sulfolobales Mexican fusellovirus 1]